MSQSHFKNTVNKEIVRSVDFKFLKEITNNSKVGYFGLPGKEILDVAAWKEAISFVHAVERGEEDIIDLQINLSKNDFDENVQIFDNELCELVEKESLTSSLPKYGIINFDFEGVLVSSGKSSQDTKLRAIEKMIQIQGQKSFSLGEKWLFLITFYAARNNTPELHEAINILNSELPKFENLKESNISEICDYLKSENANQGAKIAAIFPIWFYSQCQYFEPDCKEIVYYTGTNNAPMIHFIFVLTKISDRALNLTSLVNISRIENIPLQKIKAIKKGYMKTDNLGIPPFERKYTQN